MKNVLILSIVLLLATSVRAQFNGYHIKFQLKTTNGKTMVGFVYVEAEDFNKDSIKNTRYLKKALDHDHYSKHENFVYFKERIKYGYRPVGEKLGEKEFIYALCEKQVIAAKEIRSIAITQMIDFPYNILIANPLSIADSAWVNTTPVSSYTFGGTWCFHKIYIHKNSKKVSDTIKLLQAKKNELNDENNDEIENAIQEIIETLYREKVVIISECSC